MVGGLAGASNRLPRFAKAAEFSWKFTTSAPPPDAWTLLEDVPGSMA